MKRPIVQILAIAIVVIAFSAADAPAQVIGKFKNGVAKVSSTVRAKGKVTYKISGKNFNNLSIKQTNSGKFKYELRRGNEFLSSGHTTGSNITMRSDGQSLYSVTILNEEDVARRVDLSFINDGTEPL